jgi:hypothetical protein
VKKFLLIPCRYTHRYDRTVLLIVTLQVTFLEVRRGVDCNDPRYIITMACQPQAGRGGRGGGGRGGRGGRFPK